MFQTKFVNTATEQISNWRRICVITANSCSHLQKMSSRVHDHTITIMFLFVPSTGVTLPTSYIFFLNSRSPTDISTKILNIMIIFAMKIETSKKCVYQIFINFFGAVLFIYGGGGGGGYITPKDMVSLDVEF